jgi:hypothetical protein
VAGTDGATMNRRRFVSGAIVSRIRIDLAFLARARALIVPGTTLIVTDAPVDASTKSGKDFNILTTSPPAR